MTFERAAELVCGPRSLLEVTEIELDGQPTKVFAAAPPNIRTLYDLAAARTDEFIVYEDERWTMPDVLDLAGRIGDALVNRYGVEPGDRVAIAMRNCPQWVASFVAITSVGGIAVPLNAWWTGEEMAFAINDCRPRVVLADRARLERLRDADLDEEPVLVFTHSDAADGDPPVGNDDGEGRIARQLEDDLVDGATMPTVDIEPDDDITILYTSGTTGFPKGAVSTHRAVLNALMSFAARKAIADLMDPPPPDTLNDDGTPKTAPIFMLPVPLFHVTGLIPIMMGSFVSGAKLVMTYRWDPDRALELIERERVTNFVGVPTMSWDLLEASTFGERDVSSLQSVGGGGAPMPPELVSRIARNFPNGQPQLGYGMTETNAYGPSIVGSEFVARPKSTGRVIPSMEMRVTDPDGNVVPPGTVGEIWFKGANLIRGYWNRPESTADTIVDGWLRSGDLGWLDEDGFVYVSDRAKDMVLRGGENVYCAEVEAVIYQHPAIYEAAVFGVPHERFGEEVAAAVMAKPGFELDVDELTGFLGEHLAPFKVPTRVIVVDEQLPRNASGKILKRQLPELLF
ncbi:MAG: acyl--CoA ligase [Acidimicrobiia bacterium]|nr:acyl--CoA ligase [Acidimicrobiia bacterium]